MFVGRRTTTSIRSPLENSCYFEQFCTQAYCQAMETTNFTIENETGLRSIEQLLCSAELRPRMHYHFACLLVFNIILSITAFIGNALILVALHKESSIHPPSKLLLRCLALTDLGVGLISGPLYATYFMSVLNERWNICRFAFASGNVAGHLFSSVSLMTMTAISVERLLALQLGMGYRRVVTLKRAYVAVVVFWVVSIIAATLSLWKKLITLRYGYTVIYLCLVISTCCYTKIFLALRKHQLQVHCILALQQSQAILLTIARYRRALSSALCLQLALAVCYLPYTISAVLVPSSGYFSTIILVKMFAITILYLNSSLNPILYCWKIREVRQAVKDTIRQALCCSSS